MTAAILSNLDARDLARATATSRGWRRCTSSRILWAAVYARDFLGHVPQPPDSSITTSAIDRRATSNHGSDDGYTGYTVSDRPAVRSSFGANFHHHRYQHQHHHHPRSPWSFGRFASASERRGGALGIAGGGGARRYTGGGMGWWGEGVGETGAFGVGRGGAGGRGGVGRGRASLFEFLMDNPKEQYAKQLTERKARLEKLQKVGRWVDG